MESKPRRAIVWFRRDLRLHDLPALCAALEAADEVAPLFVLDDRILHGRWPSPNRVWFMLESLRTLDRDLRQRGGALHVRHGPPEQVVPEFARATGAERVFVSRDYTPYGRRRDERTATALAREGVAFEALPGVLAVEPEDVATVSGGPYSVYTPFRRAWERVPRRERLEAPERIPAPTGIDRGRIPSVEELGFARPTASLLAAGERAARDRLERWAANGVEGYATRRDLLAEEGTSRLSQDLRFGLLSPAEVLGAVAGPGEDREKYLAEIAWRDFYAHILWHYPRVATEPFHREFASMPWADAAATFEAWKLGHTGYPVVDAAMRQLRTLGWMHNRARMVVASFLAKDLLLDWRAGEAYFMEELLDGDPASNNGGWQWAASTGSDAQPYFRIFNPAAQGRRFDPDGSFVRRWLPELAAVPDRFIHEPALMPLAEQSKAGCIVGQDYPAPIVDHKDARGRALEAYRRQARRPR